MNINLYRDMKENRKEKVTVPVYLSQDEINLFLRTRDQDLKKKIIDGNN